MGRQERARPNRRSPTTRRARRGPCPRRACPGGADRPRSTRSSGRSSPPGCPAATSRVAVVVRRVDADAGLGVARGIRLAGARVQGVGLRVVDQRSDGVRAEAVGEELPLDVGGECVVGPPDASAGGGHPDAAGVETAGRIDRERRHAAGDAVDRRPGCRRRSGRPVALRLSGRRAATCSGECGCGPARCC